MKRETSQNTMEKVGKLLGVDIYVSKGIPKGELWFFPKIDLSEATRPDYQYCGQEDIDEGQRDIC